MKIVILPSVGCHVPGTTCCTCYNYRCYQLAAVLANWVAAPRLKERTWYSGKLVNLSILSRPRHYVRPQEFQRRMGCQPAEIKPRDSDPLVGPSFHLLERGGWQVQGWLEKLHRTLLNKWKRDLTSGKSKGLIKRGPPSIFNLQISITSPPNLLLLDHLQALVLAVIPRFSGWS